MENFHPISHAANQCAVTQITSMIWTMTTIKTCFNHELGL